MIPLALSIRCGEFVTILTINKTKEEAALLRLFLSCKRNRYN